MQLQLIEVKLLSILLALNVGKNLPAIGVLCEKEIIEPLHLKNNAVQKLYSQMLLLALADNSLSNKITSVADITECSVKRYLHALENEVKAKRLKKQLVKLLGLGLGN